jgi:hypothetical protein
MSQTVCERCGNRNAAENRFCGQCGTPLSLEDVIPRQQAKIGLPSQRAKSGRAGDPGAGDPLPFETVSLPQPSQDAVWAENVTGLPATPSYRKEFGSCMGGQKLPIRSETEENPRIELGLTGPSFLGLAEASEEDSGLDYPAEEPRPQRTRKVLVFLAMMVLAFLIGREYRQFPGWYSVLLPSRNNSHSRLASADNSARPGDIPATNSAALTSDPAPSGVPPQQANADKQPRAAEMSPPAVESKSSQLSSQLPPPAIRAIQPPSNVGSAGGQTVAALEAPGASKHTPNQRGDSLFNQGLAYLHAGGTPEHCGQALAYLRKAAEVGNARASTQLGALYATGHCVTMDRVQAYLWFTQAADANHEHNVWVERDRQILWNEMSSTEQNSALRTGRLALSRPVSP